MQLQPHRQHDNDTGGEGGLPLPPFAHLLQAAHLPEASPVAPQPPWSRLSLFPPTLHLPSPLLPPSSTLSASTTTIQPFDCWPPFDRSPAAALSSPPAEQRLGPRVNEARRRRGNEARKQGKHKRERSKKRRSKARDGAITTSVKSTNYTTDGGQDKTACLGQISAPRPQQPR
jgi:hypothetical protein